MEQRRRGSRGRTGLAGARAGIRAMRREDISALIERRLITLGFDPKSPAADEGDPLVARRIARALRAERRAARNGAGYDPLRHLVLARLRRRRDKRK